jgi:hypothetical protein
MHTIGSIDGSHGRLIGLAALVHEASYGEHFPYNQVLGGC